MWFSSPPRVVSESIDSRRRHQLGVGKLSIVVRADHLSTGSECRGVLPANQSASSVLLVPASRVTLRLSG
jgi:hypothetical protein